MIYSFNLYSSSTSIAFGHDYFIINNGLGVNAAAVILFMKWSTYQIASPSQIMPVWPGISDADRNVMTDAKCIWCRCSYFMQSCIRLLYVAMPFESCLSYFSEFSPKQYEYWSLPEPCPCMGWRSHFQRTKKRKKLKKVSLFSFSPNSWWQRVFNKLLNFFLDLHARSSFRCTYFVPDSAITSFVCFLFHSGTCW